MDDIRVWEKMDDLFSSVVTVFAKGEHWARKARMPAACVHSSKDTLSLSELARVPHDPAAKLVGAASRGMCPVLLLCTT